MGGVSHTITREKFNHRCVGNQCYGAIHFFFSFAQTILLLDIDRFSRKALPFLEELDDEHRMFVLVQAQNKI
jgi:hypothetical protein